MVYIYKENQEWKYSRILPPEGEFITLERMIPRPVRNGYQAKLNADLETGEVWYTLEAIPKTEEEIFNIAKEEKIQQIVAYDSSDEVNIITVNGCNLWLDKATRVGLELRFKSEQNVGKTETTLWYGDISFSMSIEQAYQLLYAIEVYASTCYDVTQQHLSVVRAMTTETHSLNDIETYDFKAGYPDKLDFSL